MDSADTPMAIRQNQTVTDEGSHGGLPATGNDTDGQLLKPSTADGNSDNGTNSERKEHGQPDSDGEDTSRVASTETDGMSIKSDLKFGDMPLWLSLPTTRTQKPPTAQI